MRPWVFIRAIIPASLVLAIVSAPGFPDPVPTPKPWVGRVAEVMTAETLKVQRYGHGAMVIGLAGIAAPRPEEACRVAARHFLAELLGVGDQMEIHRLGVQDERGRHWAWAYTVSAPILNASLAMTRAGLALSGLLPRILPRWSTTR